MAGGLGLSESVWSALKRAYGNPLTSRRWGAQVGELYLRTIAYNIGVANRLRVEAEANRLSVQSRDAWTSTSSSPRSAPAA